MCSALLSWTGLYRFWNIIHILKSEQDMTSQGKRRPKVIGRICWHAVPCSFFSPSCFCPRLFQERWVRRLTRCLGELITHLNWTWHIPENWVIWTGTCWKTRTCNSQGTSKSWCETEGVGNTSVLRYPIYAIVSADVEQQNINKRSYRSLCFLVWVLNLQNLT